MGPSETPDMLIPESVPSLVRRPFALLDSQHVGHPAENIAIGQTQDHMRLKKAFCLGWDIVEKSHRPATFDDHQMLIDAQIAETVRVDSVRRLVRQLEGVQTRQTGSEKAIRIRWLAVTHVDNVGVGNDFRWQAFDLGTVPCRCPAPACVFIPTLQDSQQDRRVDLFNVDGLPFERVVAFVVIH